MVRSNLTRKNAISVSPACPNKSSSITSVKLLQPVNVIKNTTQIPMSVIIVPQANFRATPLQTSKVNASNTSKVAIKKVKSSWSKIPVSSVRIVLQDRF